MFRIVICGIFGCVATITGKIAFAESSLTDFIKTTCAEHLNSSSSCANFVLLIRVVFFVSMIAANGLMVSNFLKALERHSSLMVTVVGSAINFVCTGLMGYLVLEERLGVRWIAGASLIVMGILLIVLSQGVADIKKTSN